MILYYKIWRLPRASSGLIWTSISTSPSVNNTISLFIFSFLSMNISPWLFQASFSVRLLFILWFLNYPNRLHVGWGSSNGAYIHLSTLTYIFSTIFWVPHRKSKNLQTSRPVQQARQMRCQNEVHRAKQLTDGLPGLPYSQWEKAAWFQVREGLHPLPSWYPWK